MWGGGGGGGGGGGATDDSESIVVANPSSTRAPLPPLPSPPHRYHHSTQLTHLAVKVCATAADATHALQLVRREMKEVVRESEDRSGYRAKRRRDGWALGEEIVEITGGLDDCFVRFLLSPGCDAEEIVEITGGLEYCFVRVTAPFLPSGCAALLMFLPRLSLARCVTIHHRLAVRALLGRPGGPAPATIRCAPPVCHLRTDEKQFRKRRIAPILSNLSCSVLESGGEPPRIPLEAHKYS